MPVRYDPLLARGLARELEERHAGRRTRELLLDRQRRLAALRFRDGPSLLFLLHPEAGHLVETDGAPGETRLELRGLRLEAVRAPADERLLYLELPPAGPEGTPHRVAVELHTNQWNLLLLQAGGAGGRKHRDDPSGRREAGPEGEGGEERPAAGGTGGATTVASGGDGQADGPADAAPWQIRAALWPREPGDRVLRPGARYRPPAGTRRWKERVPDAGEWRELLAPVPPEERRGTALREVAWLSSVNVGWVLGPAAGAPGADGEDTASDVAAADPDTPGGGDAGADADVDDGVRGAGAARSDTDPLDAARRRYLELREAIPRAVPPDEARGRGEAPSQAGGQSRPGAEEDLRTATGESGQTGPKSGTTAWLLERPGGLQPYVHPLDDPEAERVPSLLAGMARSLAATEGWADVVGAGAEAGAPPEPPEVAELREALEARAARLRRRVDALQRELEEGPDPEDMRETANLILARLKSVPRGREAATLEGFDGRPREVELDPSLSPSDNADRYYEEAARRERALRKIPRETEAAREELERVEEARDRLEELRARAGGSGGPDQEEVDALWGLAGGRPREPSGTPGEEERLPYRRLETSGGLELRVGKGAQSNEELTFHHSHTEDIWLHARQVPGAHVILRWGKKEENPSRRDLLEAAVVAAVNSDARHSGSVAVDWTRRKYVRSPRKSPPGVVVPRNVQTLFVEPDEKVVEAMKRRARGG